ncbi:MAG TPA: hypothetical protein VI685_15110, partial [Candidatus Angelobacter sp.]
MLFGFYVNMELRVVSTLFDINFIEFITQVPILSRDPLAFAAVVPGVIPTQGQQSNPGIIGRVTTAQIAGGLAQQNGVLIDGAESRGATESGLAYSLPIEAVSEFKLET